MKNMHDLSIYDEGYDRFIKEHASKGQVIIGVTDEKGRIAVRTKHDHPYSYDPICQFLDSKVKAEHTVYSDRMQQWDWKKYEECAMKVRSKYPTGDFGTRQRRVELLLRLYCDDPSIKLACIVEYCNPSSGYTVFRYDYSSDKVSK